MIQESTDFYAKAQILKVTAKMQFDQVWIALDALDPDIDPIENATFLLGQYAALDAVMRHLSDETSDYEAFAEDRIQSVQRVLDAYQIHLTPPLEGTKTLGQRLAETLGWQVIEGGKSKN
jgi:hypothetical protein